MELAYNRCQVALEVGEGLRGVLVLCVISAREGHA